MLSLCVNRQSYNHIFDIIVDKTEVRSEYIYIIYIIYNIYIYIIYSILYITIYTTYIYYTIII